MDSFVFGERLCPAIDTMIHTPFRWKKASCIFELRVIHKEKAQPSPVALFLNWLLAVYSLRHVGKGKKIVKSALQICIYRKNVVSLQPNSKPDAMRVHERVEKNK